MALFRHLPKDKQELMPLFDGAFIENKPIPFPNRGTTTAYSNLFYWAHLEAKETSEFPLHPHEGFEILTFVFEGSLEHFDTATQVWTPLDTGGVQVIQAGSGVSHAERIVKGTRLFQIWFDPDFSYSLLQKATYKDYPQENFEVIAEGSVQKVNYLAPSTHVFLKTPGVEIIKGSYGIGEYMEDKEKNAFYSYYLLEGKVSINGVELNKDDFLVEKDVMSSELLVHELAELFMIKTPTIIEYEPFIRRYQKN